jgi:dTDP-4-dehydrorhamnose 3,5-epimerase
MIDGVVFTPLSIIETTGGDVLHAMKSDDPGFFGFGESYFSTIKSHAIKGWKSHREMVLNLVVPIGSVKFVIFDNREGSKTKGRFVDFALSRKNYGRLTVPSKLWVAFQGLDINDSLILNIASIPHDPNESDSRKINEINYDWS